MCPCRRFGLSGSLSADQATWTRTPGSLVLFRLVLFSSVSDISDSIGFFSSFTHGHARADSQLCSLRAADPCFWLSMLQAQKHFNLKFASPRQSVDSNFKFNTFLQRPERMIHRVLTTRFLTHSHGNSRSGKRELNIL